MKEIKIGDTVRVKGQSVIMTIQNIVVVNEQMTRVALIWFDTNKIMMKTILDSEILEPSKENIKSVLKQRMCV